mmetsp:Transcript_17544/g.21024  ORF Transcript_17544/g.21024 Transcript_17544/m.21024 type:complete len:223 (-) Transcript_17544:61-729(-)
MRKFSLSLPHTQAASGQFTDVFARGLGVLGYHRACNTLLEGLRSELILSSSDQPVASQTQCNSTTSSFPSRTPNSTSYLRIHGSERRYSALSLLSLSFERSRGSHKTLPSDVTQQQSRQQQQQRGLYDSAQDSRRITDGASANKQTTLTLEDLFDKDQSTVLKQTCESVSEAELAGTLRAIVDIFGRSKARDLILESPAILRTSEDNLRQIMDLPSFRASKS